MFPTMGSGLGPGGSGRFLLDFLKKARYEAVPKMMATMACHITGGKAAKGAASVSMMAFACVAVGVPDMMDVINQDPQILWGKKETT